MFVQLYIIEHLFILASSFTECISISISGFASSLGIPVAITSSDKWFWRKLGCAFPNF